MKRLLRTLLIAGLASAAPTLHANPERSELPNIGDSAGRLISPGQEKKFGAAFMRQIRQSAKLVQDPELNDYIESLGYRLAAASDAPAYGFTFFLVRDNSINAFAGPGGYIGMNTGLLLAARNESEVAGVMAHEIAHVTQRHLLRAFEAAERMSLPTAAALIAAILIGSQDSQAGQAALVGLQAASAQFQINFTRENEHEADRVGIQTLARSGFDPMGMPSFFERLHQQTRLYGSRLPEFLSTHPVTTNRIAESTSRAEQYPQTGRKDTLDFRLARIKLLVASKNDHRDLLQDYRRRAQQNQLEPADRFGYALVLRRSGDLDGARRELKKLHKADPDRLTFRLNLAEVELARDQPRAALALYEDTLALYPNNTITTRAYATALIGTGAAAKARGLLSQLVRRGPSQDPELYRLLAEAAGTAGPQWQSHEATAEYFYLNGQTHAAIDQLQLALQSPDLTFYDNARISARLKALKQEAVQEDAR